MKYIYIKGLLEKSWKRLQVDNTTKRNSNTMTKTYQVTFQNSQNEKGGEQGVHNILQYLGEAVSDLCSCKIPASHFFNLLY